MSSCLSGGGRTYKLNLDLIKPPTSSWTSNYSSSSSSSSSSCSTLSESTNSISTRKARTPRKRPNQTYNEAAFILSTAYPKLFPTKHLTKPCKFTKSQTPFPFEPSSDLLIMPFQVTDSSRHSLPKLERRPSSCTEPISPILVKSPGGCDEYGEDLDAESILDEEIEDGIDSIMGNLSMENEKTDELSNTCCGYGFPVGLGFEFGYGMRNELRAMRNVEEGDDWWRFPSVNVNDITRKISKIPFEKKKKKKKTKNFDPGNQNSVPGNKPSEGNSVSAVSSEETFRRTHGGLLLKLNYDDVLSAWSDKGSPFLGDDGDVQTRLVAQIDLFPEERAKVRDAIVLRNKENKRNRLFSKKIKYQVNKVNASQRSRVKGRFVRTRNSPNDD